MFQYIELSHQGVYGIRSIPNVDARGGFLRILEIQNLPTEFVPCELSLATNIASGTLRGMHYQKSGMAEAKTISCISGKIFDVGVDLRKHSQSYLKSICVELGPQSEFQGLYLPSGYAHGYLSLEDNSQLIYAMDKPFSSNDASGYLWNDKAFEIPWPTPPRLISEKDLSWEEFKG
jgi:dTDP-4-dehydrorhamnose 3,5-epimerase